MPEPCLSYSVTSDGIATLAENALRAEISLTPKPGLVDQKSNGAHRDMDYPLFLKSIDAISPWFSTFYQCGLDNGQSSPVELLSLLRPAGLACEQAMYEATSGVNTHKGGIFSLGLLCCAAGHLAAQNTPLTAESVCRRVSLMCKGMVSRELDQQQPRTAGARIYKQHGLTGARGEAERGFLLVRRYLHAHAGGPFVSERRLHHFLLFLMANNVDTNLVSRGGIEGLSYTQRYARQLLKRNWGVTDLLEMDNQLICRNLSPGGSADLLSVGVFLAGIQ